VRDDDDPVTGRRFLSQSAYADDRHLRSRMSIYAYAEAPAKGRPRTAAVPWDGTQVVADIGCGNGFDLRPLVTEGRCRHAIGVDLSAGMLRTLADLRGSGRLSLIQADAQRLPLSDGSADVALAMHMLYHVPDIPAAVAELRRVTRPGGMVLASTNSVRTLTEIFDLLDAAVARQLGRPVGARPVLSFTTETGAGLLGGQFRDVSLLQYDLPLAFPGPEPVTAYLDSIREPTVLEVGGALDFDLVLADVAARVDQAVRAEGRFRTASRGGVFVCR
jgi:SAM-dependent methyltransferase